MIETRVTDKPLNIDEVFSRASSQDAGAVNIFVGTVGTREPVRIFCYPRYD